MSIAMDVCTICEGVGLVRVVDASGNWVSRPCQCQELERENRRITAAQIPTRYRDCTLDTFEIYHEADRSLREALLTSRRFVEEYPAGTAGKGLLFMEPWEWAKRTLPSAYCSASRVSAASRALLRLP